MKKAVLMGLAGISAALVVSAASAEVIYQQVVSGTYGQASGYTADGFAGVNVSVDGSDTARLVTYSNSAAEGYKFWYGDIPASAVTVLGAHSIAVQIDTCSIDASAGCGYVDAVITADPKEGGFITEGSTQYSWDNVIVVVAGPVQVRASQVSGYVNGVSLDGVRAYVGKYNTASIQVVTGN